MVRFAARWHGGVPSADGILRVRESGAAYGPEPLFDPDALLDPAPPVIPLPDPFSDLDSLLDLEDEIRSLSVQIHVATHRLLVLIAEFDRRRGWEVGGHRSCADWLSYRTGIDRGAARERVRAAQALENLPETSAAMSRGELSFSQVRALTRVATPEDEGELLEFARDNSASRLERLVRGWKRRGGESETERDERLQRSRHFSVFPDDEGMYVVKGLLPPELGLLLMRAIDAAGDVLFREEGRMPAALDPEGTQAAAARRRADALGLLAERALAAGFTAEEGAPISGTRPERYQVVLHVEESTLRSGDTPRSRATPAGGATPASGATPRGRANSPRVAAGSCQRVGSVSDAGPNSSSHRPRVSAATSSGKGGGRVAGSATPSGIGLTEPRGSEWKKATSGAGASTAGDSETEVLGAGEATPCGRGEAPRSHLDDGTRVSPATSRRLCCDAAVIRVREAPDGSVLDVGRRTRTIPPALRRALDIRDRGCRFPGCTSRFTDAHHVIHWADGGATSLSNCLLLCRHHHQLMHEGRWRIQWWGKGRPLFIDPRGGQFFDGGWKPPVVEEPPVAEELPGAEELPVAERAASG